MITVGIFTRASGRWWCPAIGNASPWQRHLKKSKQIHVCIHVLFSDIPNPTLRAQVTVRGPTAGGFRQRRLLSQRTQAPTCFHGNSLQEKFVQGV